ncbi:MAG: hypothetical protein R2800_07105 [Flavipsychrobacter sp.]
MVESTIGFLVCVIAILYAGNRLSYYGDQMSDIMGWGKMWVGMILMAGVTSLPELVTGISSIRIVDSPDMAVGNVIGSCAFNILIISLLDIIFPKRPPMTYTAQTGHVIAASFGIVLLSLVVFSILQPGVFGRIGWIGGDSLVFMLIYFFAIRSVYNYEKRPKTNQATLELEHAEEKETKNYSKQFVISRYIFFALIVVVAAMFLPYYGETIAANTGMGEGVFGTVFLALSTSLPEIVISIMAVRHGSVDMAVGNVLGSNVFNIFVLALNDMVYTKGPLLENISQELLVPSMGTILITTIGIIGLVYKSKLKWMMAIDTFFILLVYVLMTKLMFAP